MTPPLVSVAIPAYNHAKYIEACLASVCAQTYPELELVLIDDGSTDDTFEIARRFMEIHGERYRRVVLDRRENRGVSANSNACVEACSGEWVHLLGSDDLLYPNKVARIQQAITDWNEADLALVHADADFIDAEGKRMTRSSSLPRPPSEPQHDAYRWIFMGRHSIFNPTVALHRKSFLTVGGFDRSLALEDIDCWLRLSARYSIARVPEVLASYRKHPGNTLRKRVKMLRAQLLTYAKFIEANPGLLSEAEIRSQFRKNVWRFWRRMRKRQPWLFAKVLGALWQSHFSTPSHEDYQRFAALLRMSED
ncbi:MAG: glycosyl transferase [bacterium]|nr:MAG: glycosyl transferase [bacterium]KAF0148241.1 MAG: glycosyl transferase [bacterium]KAF0167736.1 MAG: glycosyl transferase [bacterium]TXT20135.1 MAG: glycosyl transferase [bacterium]